MLQDTDTQKQIELYFEQHYNKLYGLLFKMTENAQDTEDILQNTFIKAYTNSEQFRNESSLSTWICQIAIHEGYRHMKSWNKLPVVTISENLGISEENFFGSIDYTPNYDDILIVNEMREKCLRGFLRCVPQNMRVCFLLKACLELKNREIAEVMQITEANVKVTLHRARNRLKEMFDYRCSLIDPKKPCKCHLWIKYMRDHNYQIPSHSLSYSNDELKKEYFQNMSYLKKIDFLYRVSGQLSYHDFISKLQNISQIL